MAMWAKLAEPGEPHKQIKAMTGTFTATSKRWMKPGEPPMESTESSENGMILGDRFLQQDFKGTAMGKPFACLGLLGYDNQKKYVSTWADTMGTMLTTVEGMGDKVLTLTSEYDDPMTNTHKKARSVTRIESDKKHVFEWYETGPDDKEVKTMEIVYTRK